MTSLWSPITTNGTAQKNTAGERLTGKRITIIIQKIGANGPVLDIVEGAKSSCLRLGMHTL